MRRDALFVVKILWSFPRPMGRGASKGESKIPAFYIGGTSESVGYAEKITWRVGDPVFSGIENMTGSRVMLKMVVMACCLGR